MFSEGMYGLGGGIMNMRRPPNWRKRILPRVPFSSYEAAHSTSPVVEARKGGKKSNKLKYIVEALQEMEGETPEKLAMGRGYGRAMPAAQGFSLATMGGRLGEQEAMAKARREEELRRRMKLMGGGY